MINLVREYEDRVEAWKNLCPRTQRRTRNGMMTPMSDRIEAIRITSLGRRIGHSQRFTANQLGLSPGSLINWAERKASAEPSKVD